jgi:peptidoglycan hydrolase-like protein with peptidoglycan-binding domain
MPRRSSAVVGVLAAAALIGGGTAFATLRPRPKAVAAADPTVTTTTVRKMDLSDTRTVGGTLGYGRSHAVKGTGSGILTKLPSTGAKVSRGRVLYRVNNQPVVALYGDTPLFRPIGKPGLTGPDVLELRRNLTALGYHSDGPHGDVSDASLLDALKRWQKDLGLPAPGTLGPGQAVVVSGPGRISAVTAQLGDPVEEPLFSVSSTTKLVTLAMSPADAGALHTGMAVSITLPNGKEVPGKVSAISPTVTGGGADDGGADGGDGNGAQAKETVTVTPNRAVTSYDSATVQVRVTTIARKGALAVPVGALVALHEGGYALQRPDGSLMAATTGLFAGGMVEVKGAGIGAGTTVVTTP